MPSPRMQLMPHLSYEELTHRFRRCRDGRPKARWQALGLLSRPRPPYSAGPASAVVGLTADALRKLVRRSNAGGPPAVERSVGGRGQRPRLSAAPQEQLPSELLGPAPDGGRGTGPQLARRIAERTGQPMHPATGGEWRRKLGFTPQRPRPRNAQAATPEEQADGKNKSGRARRATAG